MPGDHPLMFKKTFFVYSRLSMGWHLQKTGGAGTAFSSSLGNLAMPQQGYLQGGGSFSTH